jgi:hypothetical protein
MASPRLIIIPASKHVKGCHAGLDPASIPVMDSRFRGKDRIGIYCCRSNNLFRAMSFFLISVDRRKYFPYYFLTKAGYA